MNGVWIGALHAPPSLYNPPMLPPGQSKPERPPAASPRSGLVQPDAGGNGGGLHGLCRFTAQALWLFAPCLSFVFGVRRALSCRRGFFDEGFQ